MTSLQRRCDCETSGGIMSSGATAQLPSLVPPVPGG